MSSSSRVWTNKRYKLERSENFDEFLTACGLNFLIRKLILASTPIVELVDCGDGTFLLKQESLKSNNMKFTPGVEFIDEKPNGAKVYTTMTFESENVLIHTQKNPPAMFRREFKEDEMTLVCTDLTGGVVAKRWFKAVN
ncbi:fatty acid-binding protein-like [Culicoides brevitarsis]|uniref:fatty acid-binding protein-like n=1 Tax=Culicoides brevitarsis TaxID=469753 RepID=UPI00307BD02C